MSYKDPLQALLDEAVAIQSRKRVIKQPTKPDRLEKLKEAFHSTFTNPENWLPGKAIAVIHRAKDGHQTLLGAFREFTHKHNKARKLCRSPEPMAIDCEEIVTGDWWVRREQPHFDDHAPHLELREFAFDIELGELQVFAKTALIRVHLRNTWIAKVELIEQTQFVCPTNKMFIYFPAGLDILEGMSFDNKLALRLQLEGGR